MSAARRAPVALIIVALTLTAALRAQCPDGSPPPCAGARRAALVVIDSSTALVVPLTPVGSAPTLRGFGADFAAIVVENMGVGDVHARTAPALAAVPPDARARVAARQHAGALVDGTLTAIGSRIRATVRVTDTRASRVLASITVEGTADSLLAMADRASLDLLKAWWQAQPGPRLRKGIATRSLPALRNYLAAMLAWRRGDPHWRAPLDSAVRLDPDFLAAWTWLALPTAQGEEAGLGSFAGAARAMRSAVGIVTVDSAVRRIRALQPAQTPEAARETGDLPLAPLASPAFTRLIAFALCEISFAARTVEDRYVSAVLSRLATEAECPDSVAVARAREVLELDADFAPARQLLIEELTDRGDTAGASRVLLERPLADTSWARQAREILVQRLGPPTDIDTRMLAAVAWHRFSTAPVTGSMSRSASRAARDSALLEIAKFMVVVPSLVALGRWDSAAASLRHLYEAMLTQTLPPAMRAQAASRLGPMLHSWALVSSMMTFVPADTTFLPPALDSAALRREVRLADRSMAGGDRRQEAMMQSMERDKNARVAWIHGVIGVVRHDLSFARFAATLLDSLGTSDSALAGVLALGLRGEIALAADSGQTADSLFAAALSSSVTLTPARYRFLLAQTAATAGRTDVALRLAQSLTAPSRLHQADHLAYYGPALRLEAALFGRLGRPAEAAARYREFLALWSQADARFAPEIEEARAALARLGN